MCKKPVKESQKTLLQTAFSAILPTGLYVPSTVVQLVEHLGFEPGVLGAEPHGVFHVDNAA